MEVDEVFPQKLTSRWVWFWRKNVYYMEKSLRVRLREIYMEFKVEATKECKE